MSRIIVVLGAGVLGLATLGGLALSTGLARAPRREGAPRAAPSEPNLERRLTELEQELRLMKQERRVVLSAAPAPERREPDASAQVARANPPGPEGDAAEETRIEAHYEALDAQFQSEAPDPGWAHGVESAILTNAREARFDGFSVIQAKCGSTLCKLEASAKAAGGEVPVDDLFQVVPRDRIGSAAVHRVGNPTGNQVVVYYARKGHALPED